ncbi:MAG: hypothetical protein WA624_05420 [Methylocella sp.]
MENLPAKKKSPFEVRRRRIGHIMRRLRVIAPWLEHSDLATARAYCELEVIGAELFSKIVERGVEKGDEVRAIVDAHGRVRQRQLAYARQLGLTVAARKALRASGKPAFDIIDAIASAAKDDDDETEK